ncbi:MAG: hypothetical protein AAF693_11200 [Bacteroidota bacterium]
MEPEKEIFKKLKAYKRKFFLNSLIKGVLISLASILIIFLFVNTLEYFLHFNGTIRALLLTILLVSSALLITIYGLIPALRLYRSDTSMEDYEAARNIGAFFPQVSDKLLNIIQLSRSNSNESLLRAGIAQKSTTLESVEFKEAVVLKTNKKYVPFFVIPLTIILGILIINPRAITNSTTRIVQFNKTFEPVAPFEFQIENSEMTAFKNDDFTVMLNLAGSSVPNEAYIKVSGRSYKMASNGSGNFQYTLKKIQSKKVLTFEAAGFESDQYLINVVQRPLLKTFNVYLDFPDYLKRKKERLSNVGNLQVPEGTNITWELSTLQTEQIKLNLDNDLLIPISTKSDLFTFEHQARKSTLYGLSLFNEYGTNKQPIIYNLEVIPDQYPKIDTESYQDTTLFSFIALSGNISDDYGLSKLKLHYQKDQESKRFLTKNISIDKGQNAQRFYYQWEFDSMSVRGGNQLKYYLEVWDNDGVNGSKSTKTGIYTFRIPTIKELKNEVEAQSKKTENDIDKTIQEARELKEQLEEAENRLKGKKELNWQDENLLKDILNKREELNKAIEELKKQNENTDKKRERFTPQNEKIKEKVEQLQKLMDDLLDEETKRLYEELQKLLEEQQSIEDIQDALDKLNNKESNLEKELERTLELFKRMKFENKLNETINDLNNQFAEQEKLLEKTEEKSSESQELAEEQEQLQKNFNQLQEELEELEEFNQELDQPEALPDTQEEQEEIKKSQEESKESLKEGKKKKSRDSQKKAKQQMKEMQQKLEQMQSNSEISMSQENLDDLRDIVNNLLKLSFDQEELMNDFGAVKQSDPRFVELSQLQLKLKDDAKIVEDSLLSLAKRVFVLSSFVTREVGEMNAHMDKSVEAIKDRKKPKAVSEQQFTMTSMNNLALLLDDVLQQMQENLAEAMGKPQKGKGNQKSQSLGELQQQLNQQINELKQSGKTGRELSEELAKLAAEQQRIREALKEMQEKLENEGGGSPGDGIPEKMEETEIDLVNKQITEKTIQRQKEILTRLLEAEDALRERDKDEERKAETGRDYEKQLPKAFEKYLKIKEQETELLKTIPPKLYPYYKKEVNEYFQRIGNSATTESK